jgi:outer membrane lipoprotein
MSRTLSAALLGLVVLLSGCSSVPEPLTIDESIELNNYQHLVGQQAAVGEWYRVAGVIAKIDNLAESTRIELANLPLKGDAKPNIKAEPEGRIVLYIPTFLEPVTYSPGRLLTVNAIYRGTEEAQVGDYQLDVPVLDVQNFYLWTLTERVVVDDYPSSFDCLYRYCRPYSSGPRNGRIIQDVK